MLAAIELIWVKTKFAILWYLWVMIDGNPWNEPKLCWYWRVRTLKDCFKKGK